MSEFNNIKLEMDAQKAEKLLEKNTQKAEGFKKAVFEMVALFLLIALFLFENGTLIIKKQPFLILLGNIAVMFTLSVLFDNNYRIKGKLTALSSKKFVSASEKLRTLTSGLKDLDIKTIEDNLEKTKKEQYDKKVAEKLYKVGLTRARFDEELKFLDSAKLKKMGLSKTQIKGLQRAKKVKESALSAEKLLSEVSFSAPSFEGGKSQKRLDAEHNAKSVSMYLLSAIVFAYFAVTLKDNFSIAEVGWYLMKVCFLLFRAIKSFYEAFIETSEKGSERLVNQELYLRFLLNKQEEKISKNKI